MRKIVILFFTSFLLCCMAGCALTPNASDSLHMSEEEKEIIDSIKLDYPCDTLKMYYGYHFYGFCERVPVKDLLEKPHTLGFKYALSGDGGETIKLYLIQNGEAHASSRRANKAHEKLFQYAFSYDRLFACVLTEKEMQNLNVRELYCFDATTEYSGASIYFVTNYGDYIYYYPFDGYDSEYFMPIDTYYDFVSFAKASEEIEPHFSDETWERISAYRIAP